MAIRGAHQWRGQTIVAVDALEAEAALVAQPTPVHWIGVDTLVAQQFVTARLHCSATAHRTCGARALGFLQVPWTRLEAVRLCRERAHRTDLHGVAAEVARERLVRERGDLGGVAAAGEMNERIACHFVGKAGATIAQDATLAVEQHQFANGDGLFVVALFFDVAALARTMAERLILQRALAALVADWAIEWMVCEQQLDDALLGSLRCW